MKKNWKKMFSALLLAALLYTLPGTVSWAEGTNVGAIVPDSPSGVQTVGMDSDGAGSGGSTGTGSTSGGDSGGSTTETGGTTGGDSGTGSGSSTETGGTSGSESGGSTTETGGTAGGNSTGTGSGSSTETGGTSGSESGGSTTETGGTTGGDSGTGSGSSTEATPTPTVTPTPTATPTPTPSLPIVTKDPTDETVDVGGDCWFIANYSNALYAVWHFVSPDGKTDYRFNDQAVATAFPGLRIENGDQSNLHLSSIPAQMNGWGAYCEYSNNTGSVRTNAAVVHVNGAPAATPTPSPSATPTPTPSPTPSPAATSTAAPSPSPETSPSPQVSPTPEASGEPATALNRGGKIFLLFGAVALVVGAAAIGTILLVSKRMSEKEAYTYKSSSRRRK